MYNHTPTIEDFNNSGDDEYGVKMKSNQMT